MKIHCKSENLFHSIVYANEQDEFRKKYFSGNKTFNSMPIILVSLYDEKTLTQLGTCWRDWSIAAKFLYTDKETIYYMLLKAPEFKEIWLEESIIGKSKKKTYRFCTLSGLSKEKTADLITRYRDYLQEIINKEHGEYIPINWSKKENINKPDVEKC